MIRLLSAVFAFAVLFGAVRPVYAQVTEPIIAEIRIEGNQRIEAETVRSYMTIAVGDRFDAERIDRSLKNLFRTGLFADVNIRRAGPVLVITIVENPIINRIAFEGNKRIDDDVLAPEIQLRPRHVYTRTKLQNDIARIIEIYRLSGRFATTVVPKVIQLEQNRVDLVFEIDEGDRTDIRKISFIGNRYFSDGTLRDELLTKETVWYRFLSVEDSYDPNRLNVDQDRLRSFYLSNGFADFRVISTVAELSRDRSGFFVTFTVEEGERYRLNTVTVVSEMEDLSIEDLMDDVITDPGDWYNADDVEESIQELSETIGSQGFAFVDIRPDVQRDRERRLIDLTYTITEGSRVFVERVDIVGNFRTLDEVIRREMRLVEGDAFSSAKLRRSRQRITNLGFFAKVDVRTTQGAAGDKAIIEIEVEEQPTGELSFGAGFSSFDGVLAEIAIRERNLLGKGQDLRLGFTLSGRRQEIDFSFTEPYFLDRELSAGVDLFSRKIDLTDQNSFQQDTLGGSLRLGYPLADRLRQTLNYTLRQDEIRDVPSTASRFIRSQEGLSVTSSIGQIVLYDQRDSRFNPTDGYAIRFQQDVAGLGGDVNYLRHRLTLSGYYPVSEEWIGSVILTGGHIFGFGDDSVFGEGKVRLSDRFFVGGSAIRGFDTAGIGPRDARTDDALGGNLFGTGSITLSFPFGLPSEFDLRGRVFTDFGTLTEVDDDTNLGLNEIIIDEPSIRASAGFGISYVSPIGPIQIDFGFPYLKEDFDRTETIRFTFGTRF